MPSNPLKTISQALTGTLDVPTATARAVQARQAVLDTGAAVESAKAAMTAADEAGEPGAIQGAEAQLIAAERTADRATRALAIAEDTRQRAQAAAEASTAAEHRKHLAALLTKREQAGTDIENALTLLEAGVKRLIEADTALAGLPVSVRGQDLTIGHNIGAGPLAAHLQIELGSRSIVGQPSSVGYPSFAQWLATGNELLRQRV